MRLAEVRDSEHRASRGDEVPRILDGAHLVRVVGDGFFVKIDPTNKSSRSTTDTSSFAQMPNQDAPMHSHLSCFTRSEFRLHFNLTGAGFGVYLLGMSEVEYFNDLYTAPSTCCTWATTSPRTTPSPPTSSTTSIGQKSRHSFASHPRTT